MYLYHDDCTLFRGRLYLYLCIPLTTLALIVSSPETMIQVNECGVVHYCIVQLCVFDYDIVNLC